MLILGGPQFTWWLTDFFTFIQSVFQTHTRLCLWLTYAQAVTSWILQAEQSDLRKYQLEPDEVAILKEVQQFLFPFHEFQQLLSAELTPTIHQVIPTFYIMINKLEEAQKKQPILSHAYDTALLKLREYLDKCRRNPIYTIAIGQCCHCDIPH
jgi:hypothetical protein